MLKALLVLMSLSFVGAISSADQTLGEKVDAGAHTAKRHVKKGAHRAEEAVCTEGDLKCAAQKGKHRVQEGADSVKDGTKKAVDKVD